MPSILITNPDPRDRPLIPRRCRLGRRYQIDGQPDRLQFVASPFATHVKTVAHNGLISRYLDPELVATFPFKGAKKPRRILREGDLQLLLVAALSDSGYHW